MSIWRSDTFQEIRYRFCGGVVKQGNKSVVQNNNITKIKGQLKQLGMSSKLPQ